MTAEDVPVFEPQYPAHRLQCDHDECDEPTPDGERVCSICSNIMHPDTDETCDFCGTSRV